MLRLDVMLWISYVVMIDVCIAGECAPESTFIPVQSQVIGYAQSFRENLLFGDEVVTTPNVEECREKAVLDDYPSYYFDSTTDEGNCLLTHVTVNVDYSFPDPTFNTQNAPDKIIQRFCKFDGVEVATVQLKDDITYHKSGLESCFRLLPQDKQSIQDQLKADAGQQIRGFNEKCARANAQLKTVSFEVVLSEDSVQLRVTIESEVSATGEFTSAADVSNCADHMIWNPVDVHVENTCHGATVTVSATDNGAVRRTTSAKCSNTDWLFGPNDAACYDKNLHPLMQQSIYEVFPGKKCSLPDEPLIVQESTFACYLGCARDTQCRGYSYNIELRWCQRLTGDCQNTQENHNFIYYKRKD